MKKIAYCVLLFTFIVGHAAAQKPVVPLNGTPGKNPLPTPRIKILLPDLNVPAISFVEGHKDATAGKYYVTLHLTISNSGPGNSSQCKLSLNYQRESTHGFYFESGRPELNFQALNAGQSVSGDYTFSVSLTELGLGTYAIPVKVFIDCFNEVKESNENNNISAPITITLHL